MKKGSVSTFILILVFLIGLSLMLYPTVSNYWNSMHQSQAIVDYEAVLNSLVPEDYSDCFAQADAYNRQLLSITFPLKNHEQIEGYEEILNVDGSGIIGYVTIPKLDAELPIYHGTSEAVLGIAVGHLQGTSFPIGGESTHAVLSAHRGLPSARLFTDLDEMEEGDRFSVKVLNRLLTYEVDQILVVLPHEVDALYITEGEDYCTLFTCTPYGVNTHRLLVRGRRVEDVPGGTQTAVIHDTTNAEEIDPVLASSAAAALLIALLLIWILVTYRNKGKAKEKHHE